MSGVEWLGQPGSCPEGWTALPNNVCVRQSPGGWPEYRCAEGYFGRQTSPGVAPTECVPIQVPTQPLPPTPARRGSVLPALAVAALAVGIFAAVVR